MKFQKGNIPHNYNGGRCKTWSGYIMVTQPTHPRANSNGYVREHIIIAEKLLGKSLPPQACIHHYGKTDDNFKIVICQDHSYHMLLHGRERVMQDTKLNGKLCPKCETRKLFTAFRKDRTTFDGLDSWCKSCRPN